MRPVPMFRIERTGDHVEMAFGGKLHSEGMKGVLDEFAARCEGIEGGTMLYRIEDFQLPSAGAVMVEFSRLPGLMRQILQFRRVAVLADESWIRKASEWEGRLLPGLEVRGFPLHDEDGARKWLREGE